MRRPGWWNSITVKVWALIAVSLILVVGVAGAQAVERYQQERDAGERVLVERASIYAQFLSDELGAQGSDLQMLHALRLSLPRASTSCAQVLSALTELQASGYVAVVTAAGHVRCSSSGGPKAGARAFAGDALVRQAVRERTTGSDGPITDPESGRLALIAMVPLPDGSSLLSVRSAQQVLRPSLVTSGLVFVVVDTRTGLVLSRWPHRADLLGRSVGGTGLQEAVAQAGTTASVTSLDGVRRLFHTRDVPGRPFRVLVGYADRDVLSTARQSLLWALLLGLLLLGIVVGMAWLVLRGVTNPVRNLQGQIYALAEDPESSLSAESGPKELVAAVHAVNAIARARRRVERIHGVLGRSSTEFQLVLDGSLHCVYASPGLFELFGVVAGEDLTALLARTHPEDLERTAAALAGWLEHGSGDDLHLTTRSVDLSGTVHRLEVLGQDLRADPDVSGVVFTITDVTERLALQEERLHLTSRDTLTGLLSRGALLEDLVPRLAGERASATCLLLLSLESFALVNDSHGHDASDRLLVQFAGRLRGLAVESAVLGRVAEGEFAVVVEVEGIASALELAGVLGEALREPLTLGRREIFPAGSLGLAFGRRGEAPEVLLREAHTAARRAKKEPRDGAVVFDAGMHADAQRMLRTENDLHRALEREQFQVAFQPLVTLGQGRFEGVEALLRWEHPVEGTVAPSDFIPVAEQNGMIVPIGEWVMREACAWAAGSALRLCRPVHVAVNVSPRQLAQTGFALVVEDVLSTTGLAPELLCLEVTESLLVQDFAVATRVLSELHDRGVRLSIDDFGTGWSSLTYLQQFPVDEIKLDRSYVSRVASDPGAAMIVAALVRMAHTMGMSVIAEGVETRDQLRFLQVHGCDAAQGFLFARPMTGEQAERLLGEPVLDLTDRTGPQREAPSTHVVPEQAGAQRSARSGQSRSGQ